MVNSEKTISLGNIPVGTKQYQVSWKVNVAPSAVDKVEEYSVTLVADNADSKILKRKIEIPTLQQDDQIEVKIEQVQDNTYRVNMLSNNQIPKVVLQFKTVNGAWMQVADIKNNSKFIMSYVEKDTAKNKYKYQKTVLLTNTGKREFRLVFLDTDENKTYISKSYYINASPLVTYTVDSQQCALYIKKQSDLIKKIKVVVGDKEENIQVSNKGIDENFIYSINPKNFETGTYGVYLKAYDVSGNLLEVTESKNIYIENPFKATTVTPNKIDANNIQVKNINIGGSGFNKNTTIISIIDGGNVQQVEPLNISNNIMTISVPECIRNATFNKVVTIRVSDSGVSYDFNISVTGKASEVLQGILDEADYLTNTYRWTSQKNL